MTQLRAGSGGTRRSAVGDCSRGETGRSKKVSSEMIAWVPRTGRATATARAAEHVRRIVAEHSPVPGWGAWW
ncbi:hypothetical protein WKI65_27090 [Streptomyces sp. MS1.AVA.3]|uniref:hypothetical protein n=1 Tax=Streptomyces decoyicus TaxID=249567 RepID=UPI0030BB783E